MSQRGDFGRAWRGLGLAAVLAVSPMRADPLVDVSPFLPPGGAADAAKPTENAPIELRGIMVNGDETMFSIYDPSRHLSSWAKVNEVGRDFIIRGYDAAHDAVTVDYGGRTITLTLHTAKIVGAPATTPAPVAARMTPPPTQPVGGPVVLNPSPADEQRRLEAIAAEVNRRRMIRQQALQAARQAAQQAGQQNSRPGPPPVQVIRPRQN